MCIVSKRILMTALPGTEHLYLHFAVCAFPSRKGHESKRIFNKTARGASRIYSSLCRVPLAVAVQSLLRYGRCIGPCGEAIINRFDSVFAMLVAGAIDQRICYDRPTTFPHEGKHSGVRLHVVATATTTTSMSPDCNCRRPACRKAAVHLEFLVICRVCLVT